MSRIHTALLLVLTDDVADVFGVVHLARDQAEEQLVIPIKGPASR
jgi:hypothetical protein